MLHEWFGQGLSFEIIIIDIIFTTIGIIACKVTKKKIAKFLIFLIPCIVIILCEIGFYSSHSNCIGILSVILGGPVTLFLIGVVVCKIRFSNISNK